MQLKSVTGTTKLKNREWFEHESLKLSVKLYSKEIHENLQCDIDADIEARNTAIKLTWLKVSINLFWLKIFHKKTNFREGFVGKIRCVTGTM